MNLDNPTRLHPGATARFLGRPHQLVGRAVLTVTDRGRPHYWHEFYLAGPDGQLTTLVYEVIAYRSEWRWFSQFDPPEPFTAETAGICQVGDLIELQGLTARVEYVRESAVVHAEGRRPEGVRPGARANYFNAVAGSVLFVVSWTGPEIEFYRGTNLTAATVAAAFKLMPKQLVRQPPRKPWFTPANIVVGLFGPCVVILVVLLIWGTWTAGFDPSPDRDPPRPARRVSAPPAAVLHWANPGLRLGGTGKLAGVEYRLVEHREVEVVEMGRVRQRHEYLLRDGDGVQVGLIQAGIPRGTEWWLLRPVNPPTGFTPQVAGGVRVGQKIKVADGLLPVDELFRATTLKAESTGGRSGSAAGERRFGFSGEKDGIRMFAEWDEEELRFATARRVPAAEVLAAFR